MKSCNIGVAIVVGVCNNNNYQAMQRCNLREGDVYFVGVSDSMIGFTILC